MRGKIAVSIGLALGLMAAQGAVGAKAAAPTHAAAAPESIVNPNPVAWPEETTEATPGHVVWNVYTQMGDPVQDKSKADGDCSTGGTAPSGATDIVRGDPPDYRPSALWAYDPATGVFFYRIRVDGMPLTPNGENKGERTGGDPWASITWNLLIDADNDGWKEFTVVLDGDSGGKNGSDISVPPASNDGDDLKIYYNDLDSQCVTTEAVSGNQVTTAYDLVWWGNAGTQNAVVPASHTADGATWDFGRTRCVYHTAANTTWGSGYFVDFQFPISALTDAYNSGYGGNPLVACDTPVAFGYSTSNSNQDPLQKDYATNFCYTAGCDRRFPYSDVVTLCGGTATAPIIGAMTLTDIDCPSSVTVHVAVASALQVVPPYTGTGVVDDTIASVLFEYYLDANGNGIADDGASGSSWQSMAVVSGMAPNPDVNGNVDPMGNTSASIFNNWGVVWNTSSLTLGQYLIQVTALDENGASANKVVGSYILASGSCGGGPNLSWASYADAAHAVPSDLFGNYPDTVVYMGGYFESHTEYVVAFYDAGGTLLTYPTVTSGSFGNLGATLTLVSTDPVGTYHAVVFPAGTTPPATYSAGMGLADDTFEVLAGLLRNAQVTQLSPQDPSSGEIFFQSHPQDPALDPADWLVKPAFVSGGDFDQQIGDMSSSLPLIFYELVGYDGDTLRVTKEAGKIVIRY
jgi:hypothetical protein